MTKITVINAWDDDVFEEVNFQEELEKGFARYNKKHADQSKNPNNYSLVYLDVVYPHIYAGIKNNNNAERLSTGSAECGRNDLWNPSIGTRIAIHRAIRNLFVNV